MYAYHLSRLIALNCFNLTKANFSFYFNQKHTKPSFINWIWWVFFSLVVYTMHTFLYTCYEFYERQVLYLICLLNDFYLYDYHGIIYSSIYSRNAMWFSSVLQIIRMQQEYSHVQTIHRRTIQLPHVIAVKLLWYGK